MQRENMKVKNVEIKGERKSVEIKCKKCTDKA